MPEADRTLGMYLHLARASHARKQPMVCDKLLVLAGVQAQQMGLEQISALCRHKVLSHNARHLLRRWPTVTAALADERFQSYLKQLRRRYSPEKTEHMLHSLGVELGRERDAYFSDLEYASALLDTRPESIAEVLAQDPNPPGSGRRGRIRPEQSSDSLHANAPRQVTRGVPWTPEQAFHVLVVWGPFFVGLLILAGLTILSRVADG
jgi:hypothetical protein